jgi:hypothetical protein
MNSTECRICLETEENMDELINPCLCDGTSKWVHRKCLNEWRETNTNSRAYTNCMECNYEYKFSFTFPRENDLLKNSFFQKYKILYFFICYFSTLPITFVLKYEDVNSNLIKVLCYNDTRCVSFSLDQFQLDSVFNSFIYHSFVITMYANIYTFIFTLIAFLKKHRKNLFVKLFYKHVIFNYLAINNIFILFYIFMNTNAPTFYFLTQFFLTLYNMYLTLNIIYKHSKIVKIMNSEFNTQIIMNYDANEINSDEENLLNIDANLDEHLIELSES